MKKEIQTKLRACREAKGWTQFELSLKSGIPAAAISFYECGERGPSIYNLRRLKKALHCTWDELLG